jgi:hypothetical protein
MTGQRLSPRAMMGDPANDDYVLTTVGGVPVWLPTQGVQSVTQGAGVTVDNTDPKNPRVSSTGGGAIAGFDRRWNVGPSETSIDEFNDNSIAAAMVRVDAAGGAGRVIWTEAADTLSAELQGGDGTGELHGYIRPLSGVGGSLSTGDAFVTHIAFGGSNSNFVIGGLVLSDGTTYGSGNQVFASIGNGPNSVLRPFTLWTTPGTAIDTIASIFLPTYLRLVYLGSNTWRQDLSSDAVSWRKGTSGSKTITPTQIGFAVSSWGLGNKSTISFELLRRVAGIT